MTVYSIFGIQWVSFALVREVLLGWYDSFIGRRRIKAWRATSLCIFLDYLKGNKQKMF